MARRIPPNQDGPTYPARPGKPKVAPPGTDEWHQFRAKLVEYGFSREQIDRAIGSSIGSQSRGRIVRGLISLVNASWSDARMREFIENML